MKYLIIGSIVGFATVNVAQLIVVWLKTHEQFAMSVCPAAWVVLLVTLFVFSSRHPPRRS